MTTASVRGRHQRLSPHAGDVLDPAAVLRPSRARCSHLVFGVPCGPFREIAVYSIGTRNIVHAMQKHVVQRCLGVTSGGTRTAPRPSNSAFFEWFTKPLFGRTTQADQRTQDEIVMRSSLRWTIAARSACGCVGDRQLPGGATICSAR